MSEPSTTAHLAQSLTGGNLRAQLEARTASRLYDPSDLRARAAINLNLFLAPEPIFMAGVCRCKYPIRNGSNSIGHGER
jgi:hypothetical protein